MAAHDRIVTEDGLDARIAAVVEPVIEDLGFRLVRVRMMGGAAKAGSKGGGGTLQIMAERPDGTMSVSDCETVSKAVSPALDVEDPVPGAYNLEVSSPGIDRPLVRASDFEHWAGHVAKLETAFAVEGRRRFKGTVLGVEGGHVVLRREERHRDGDEADARLPLDAIADARLVLTDGLIRESLRRDKALRQANGIPDADIVDADIADADASAATDDADASASTH